MTSTPEHAKKIHAERQGKKRNKMDILHTFCTKMAM
jgi:hypothetical protein